MKFITQWSYLVNGDTINGESVLNTIPDLYPLNNSQLFEHQQYLSFFNLKKHLMQEGKSIAEADSAQIQALTSLMNNSNGQIAGYARNLLVAKGLSVYREPYLLPDGEVKSSRIRYKRTNGSFNANQMKVYPNPARDYIIIDYTLTEGTAKIILCIYDVNGKTRLQIPLDNTSDFIVVPVSNLPAGSYLCSILQNNEPVKSVRFIVVK